MQEAQGKEEEAKRKKEEEGDLFRFILGPSLKEEDQEEDHEEGQNDVPLKRGHLHPMPRSIF